MVNVSLTYACNRSCPFCFARHATQRPDPWHMPLARVDSVLDFLVESGVGEARLLGGEPTLHPDFERIVDRVLERGLRLVVFSGGLMPEAALRKLAGLPASDLSVLVNVSPLARGRPVELAGQERSLRVLGRRVTLGVTIDSPVVELSFLLDLLDHHDLARSIRLGIAHPTLDGSNAYLHPRHYPEVGRRVTEFALEARERRVQIDFDCGWVPCMFPPGALAALGLAPAELGLRCGPMLDLLPDGRVIPCYPLAAFGSELLARHRDADGLRAQFFSQPGASRSWTLQRECETCGWREQGECAGGCLAASLRRLRHRDFAVDLGGAA